MDLLSSFPEHLQDEILTRLDLRDTVRTSALSRAWRRRWETLPGLAVSFPDGTPPSVVDRVLLRYAGPSVSRFKTHVDDDDDDAAYASHVDEWLIALSRRSVESITIYNDYGRNFTVHSSIFSCDRLLSGCPSACSGAAFHRSLSLELSLTDVKFADNGESQFEAMIRASPMLGVLVLEEIYTNDMDRVIEALNLHTLRHTFTPKILEAPNLQYAYQLHGAPAGFVEFLAGVFQVRELIFYVKPCDLKVDAIPFTFSNLKSMELFTDFAEMNNILLMFSLLRTSPNLEKLKIELQRPKMVDNRKFLNAQWTNGMCANLQLVEIISYNGWLPLYFIELILSKASFLRTLSVDMDACPVSQDNQLNELL
ncbi:unnamed protein product [Miscanthus lutarioriparius]|uniref:F-box domain-containing protein n=1 Tax=Miscanthus lutarioriparius TaxID=422564 RepID=A0A811N643_9POAL|nr:unnamed protein product [Miscanthus lutarioriparius]